MGGVLAIFAVSKAIARPVGSEALLIPGAMLIALDLLEFRQSRRGAQSLLHKRFAVCSQCRYCLESLGDAGICPECGSKFTRSELESVWRRRYKRHFEGTTRITPLEDPGDR